MSGLLPDPGTRTGWELAVYRVGNMIALLLMALCVLAVLCVLALGVYTLGRILSLLA